MLKIFIPEKKKLSAETLTILREELNNCQLTIF